MEDNKLKIYKMAVRLEYNKPRIFGYERKTTQKYLSGKQATYTCVARNEKEAINKYKKFMNIEKIKLDIINLWPGKNHKFTLVFLNEEYITVDDTNKIPILDFIEYLLQEDLTNKKLEVIK